MVRVGSSFSRRYVQRRAVAVMIDTITIHRPTKGTFDTNTGLLESDISQKIYEGQARIYTVEGPSVISVGEADLSMRNTYISIPANSSPVPNRDDVIMVLEAVSDDDLQGRSFRVLDVSGGGLVRAVRRMLCVGIEESSAWGQ